MAKRYSGNLQINVVYDDKNHYRTTVSQDGKLLWSGIVNPAPAGFGPGVAYDSAKAYDEIARSALSFAEDEQGGIADAAEFDETRFLVHRTPRAARSAVTSHATKKSPGLTDTDFRQAAKFEMKRFGLTLPEALRLVKDKRYPGILKTIEDWRARRGWPAANSSLARGYVYELLGLRGSVR